MAQVLKRENLTIVIGTYQKDGAEKKRYKTIGELVTMQGDDGSSYQFGEMWGPTGSTKFNVYDQQDNSQQAQAPQQQMQQQAPQGYRTPPQNQPMGVSQQQPQGGFQQR